MRPLRLPRFLLEVYFVVLLVLAAVAFLELVSTVDLDVTLGLVFFVATLGWAIVAFATGGFVSTFMRPDMEGLVLATGDPSLAIPENNPAVLADLREKMSGRESDLMAFAGGNALFCLVLAILFNFLPFAGVLALEGATAVMGLLVAWRHLA